MILYNQLYEILQNAIYGSNATLDTFQQFVLTQMSTYLSYGLCLLPVIAIVAVTVKLLKW